MSGDAPPTLLKVGGGEWTRFTQDVSDMDRTDLLRALKAESFLAQDTLIGDCKVFVLKPAKDQPLPAGLLSATEVALEFDATIKSLLDDWGPDIPHAKLFIRVETPAPPAAAGGAGADAGAAAATATGGSAAPSDTEAILAAIEKLALRPAAAAPRAATTSSVAMSKASKALLAAAVLKRRLTVGYAEMPPTTPTVFRKFEWGSLSEAQATGQLRAHFWAQLTAALPAGAHHQLPRGLAADCQIVDAQQASLELSCEYASRPGADPVLATVRGYPDAVVTLRCADGDLSPTVLTYACTVIDWKTPTAIESPTVKTQLLLEALALRPFTRRPVPVIATDCATSMRVWLLSGHVLTEYVPPTPAAEEGGAALQELAPRRRLTLEEGCALLTQHLLPAAVAGAASQYSSDLANNESDGTEDDDDSGDEDSELGGAGGSGGGGGGFLRDEGYAGGMVPPPTGGDTVPGGTAPGGATSGVGSRRVALAPLPSSVGNQLRSLAGPRAQKRLLAQFESMGFSVADLVAAGSMTGQQQQQLQLQQQ